MQTRLTRSRTESMIGGVCGGLGEYFSVDPVMVRFIFVLVTFTSGLGPPVYLLLWLLMPRQSQAEASALRGGTGETLQEPMSPGQVRVSHPTPYVQHPRTAPPEAWTGSQAAPPYAAPPGASAHQAGWPETPSTGQTIRLEKFSTPAQADTGAETGYAADFAHTANFQAAANPSKQGGEPVGGQMGGQPEASETSTPHQRPRDWRKLGLILIGLGTLIIVNHFVSMAYIFPSLLIIAGIMLLRRSR